MGFAPPAQCVRDEFWAGLTAQSLLGPMLRHQVVQYHHDARAGQGEVHLDGEGFAAAFGDDIEQPIRPAAASESPMKSIAHVVLSCGGASNGTTSRVGTLVGPSHVV